MAKIENLAPDWANDEILATYYWIHWSESAPDGTFIIKTSDYTAQAHMTGFAHVKPDAPDYALWQWIVKKHKAGELKSNIISKEDLDTFRAEFAASAA